jgi:hypothetical protein
MTKICARCSVEFTTEFHTKKYCSRKCSLETSNEKYKNKSVSELTARGMFCWSEYKDKTVII